MKLVELCAFILFLMAVPWLGMLWILSHCTTFELVLILVILVGALTR